MRMKILLKRASALLLFMVFLGAAFAQEGWKTVQSGAIGKDLNAVYFVDQKRGWVAGDDGFVGYTSDGGATWAQQAVATKDSINDIYFRNKDNGYLLAGSSIFQTDNGGHIWTEIRRYFASDFGETWSEQLSNTKATLYHVDFRNEREGWTVGERGTILRTIDGGLTWILVETTARGTLLSVAFPDGNNGWIVGRSGVILRSGDGGRTWIQQESKTKQNLYALFIDKKMGWTVGGKGTILQYER